MRLRIVIDEGTGCWLWQMSVQNQGYGQVMVAGKMWLVHRLVWSLYVGPIPDGFVLDHQCRVRRCCNPAHLRLVTPTDNTTTNTTNRRIVNSRRNRCMRDLHDLTGDNVRVRADGTRVCKACVRERWRAKQRALGREVIPRKN